MLIGVLNGSCGYSIDAVSSRYSYVPSWLNFTGIVESGCTIDNGLISLRFASSDSGFALLNVKSLSSNDTYEFMINVPDDDYGDGLRKPSLWTALFVADGDSEASSRSVSSSDIRSFESVDGELVEVSEAQWGLALYWRNLLYGEDENYVVNIDVNLMVTFTQGEPLVTISANVTQRSQSPPIGLWEFTIDALSNLGSDNSHEGEVGIDVLVSANEFGQLIPDPGKRSHHFLAAVDLIQNQTTGYKYEKNETQSYPSSDQSMQFYSWIHSSSSDSTRNNNDTLIQGHGLYFAAHDPNVKRATR